MKTVNAVIGRVENIIGVTMLIVIVGMVFLAAITRTFERPIVWSVDLAQLLFIWISMLGADIALKNKAHVGVDMLVRKFPDKLNRAITLCTYLLSIAFLAFMAYWGVRLCIGNYLRTYQTMGVSYSFGTAAIPVGAVCMILTFLEQLFDLLRDWNLPGAGVPPDLRDEFKENASAGEQPA